MAASIQPGSHVVRTRRLGGGLGSATHAFALRMADGAVRRLVLKPGDRHLDFEWDGLHVAQYLPLPSPDPVALDRGGDWFGSPAVVIGQLPLSLIHI